MAQEYGDMTFDVGNGAMDSEAYSDPLAQRVALNALADRVPHADLFAAMAHLGSVVCLHREADAFGVRHDLLEVIRGTRAVVLCDIDAQGPVEALCFVDDEGRSRVQVGLLPDSDFLAWEVLQRLWQEGALHVPDPDPETQGQVLTLPARMARWLGTRRWTSTPGRFVLDSMGHLGLLPMPLHAACVRRAAERWAAVADRGGMALDSQCRCPRRRLDEPM
jgi:hypothetical protein